MGDKGLVSIIIPVFNVRPYITEAIDSVVRQTYKELEILIIDDGSTDGSGTICDDYARKDERIIVIHQDNKGLSAARNAGLDIMKGDTVAFLDPDDKYDPEYIYLMLSALQEKNADIVICKNAIKKTTNQMVLKGKEKVGPRIGQGIYNRVDSLKAYADGSINPNVWNKLYKRELWENIRFPVGHVYEDFATTFRVFNLCNRVYVMDKVMYIRRLRSNSITSIRSFIYRYDFALALLELEKFMEENILTIFSEESLLRIRKLRLYQLVSSYMLCFGDNSDVKPLDSEMLRSQIISLGKEVGIKGASFKIIIAYWMICFCPWVFNLNSFGL